MITKCCIVCLCMTASAMLGLAHTKAKRARVRYFASCVRLAETLIAEISFRRATLTEVLRAFCESDASELRRHVEAFCASPYEPFTPAGKLLKADEKRLMTSFFSSLGTSDAQTQIFELENFKQRFCELYEKEDENFKRTGSVGLKLSILLGLAVGILIV